MTFVRKLLPYLFVPSAFFLSCGNETNAPTLFAQNPQPVTELSEACASPLFTYGRSIRYEELRNFDHAQYVLESALFRNVIYRSANEVELAYLTEVKMKLHAGRFLVPESQVLCRDNRRPSRRSERLARTMIPIVEDLHLPSARITPFEGIDRSGLYNEPRISEVSILGDASASYNNQNRKTYRRLQSLADYLDLLRQRHFYSYIDVRELGSGRIAIVAEKDIGGERSQLFVTMIVR